MKLFLVASSPLQPFVERLLPLSPHRVEAAFLPNFSSDAAAGLLSQQAASYDAVLLADGAAALPPEGLAAGLPLVLPRVHNAVALLLGGAARYRRIFSQQEGGVCWRVPACGQELFFSPRADCGCLCYLADTQLGLPDGSLAARVSARQNGWDFLHVESDPSLLEALVCGPWEDGGQFLTVPAGGRASLSYTAALMESDA